MTDPSRRGIGASITLEQLDLDPHPLLAQLRATEPVSWLPALDGWLVTSYELAVAVMRDPDSFTVDDSRFSTGRVIGPSMLSLDGSEHARQRAPFLAPFRAREVRQRFAQAARLESERLIDTLAPEGRGELRRGFAGPFAAAIVTRALGLDAGEVPSVLAWYDAIVADVTEITAGRSDGTAGKVAFAELGERLRAVIASTDEDSLLAAAAGGQLTAEQTVSNAAVLLFGGIETTEGMIANALVYVLGDPELRSRLRRDPDALDAAIEESLRLEPAAAVIDRYATRRTELGGAAVAAGDLVRVSITAANRDPSLFPDPDRFELARANRRHLAFAHGPHVCVGVHLARLEARVAIGTLLERLPELRLDPANPAQIRGLVFRKPPQLHATWA